MKYLNQLEHEDIAYPTDVETEDSPMHQATIREAGCGLCSLCMVVDQLTMESLPLQRCVELSIEHEANHAVGTDMERLGPVVAEAYSLTYGETDDLQQVIGCLQRGGCAIANVGGDRDDGAYLGVFSHGGHYIALISADEEEVCVLDPSWRDDKFVEPGREGKVRMVGKFVYCAHSVLDRDCENRSPRYHLFTRK